MLTQATKIDPSFHYAWTQMGLSYKREEEYAKALSAYDIALSINPDNVSYLVQTSNLLIKLENYKIAEKRLERITQLEPKEFFAWLNLGRVRHRLNKSGARMAGETALRLEPKNPEAIAFLQLLRSENK
jgi:tetratricopeptide (TPR) repeat protein